MTHLNFRELDRKRSTPAGVRDAIMGSASAHDAPSQNQHVMLDLLIEISSVLFLPPSGSLPQVGKQLSSHSIIVILAYLATFEDGNDLTKLEI